MALNNVRNLYRLSSEDIALIDKKNSLYQLYKLYTHNYLPHYKYHIMREYLALKEEFPDIDFDMDIRVKSEYSYREKINRKLAEGNSGRVYDIFASKIIIKSVNGKDDEDTLIDACYRIEDFIDKKSEESIIIPSKSKDYIQCPKSNGYQSIHLSRFIQMPKDSDIPQNSSNPNNCFIAETQIKTFRMKNHEEYGEASHSKNYKDRTSLLHNIRTKEQAEYYLPHYLQLVHDTKNHFLTIPEKSFEERFKYFFNIDFSTHLANISNRNK